MTPREIAENLNMQVLSPGAFMDNEVSSGICSDLLSWVMAHGKKDGMWITIQTHINIIAVASLLELSCIIISGGAQADPKTIDKAREEGITLLASGLTSYELAGRLYALGVGINDQEL